MLTIGKIAAVFGVAVLLPVVASAQAVISGVVRDASGAVLPGVTVEAASPALIEKVRTTVTDGTGQDAIENLRPGLYTVTFTLPGFSVVQRGGVELSGSFIARINADLRVGGVEETITVTGESPVVDVQSTRQQRVMDREILDTLPNSGLRSTTPPGRLARLEAPELRRHPHAAERRYLQRPQPERRAGPERSL